MEVTLEMFEQIKPLIHITHGPGEKPGLVCVAVKPAVNHHPYDGDSKWSRDRCGLVDGRDLCCIRWLVGDYDW